MSIPSPVLDNFTWSDLTLAARRRITAASKGRWTLHAPVDPGVTLLELHAWLLEQRLYWMDQIPDALTRGALALLGEKPLDAQCASTVFQFITRSPGTIPAGTWLRLQSSDPPLIFSTSADVFLLPLATDGGFGAARPPILRLGSGTSDRYPDIKARRGVCLFGAGTGAEFEITLRLSQKLQPEKGDLTLLFLLHPSAGVAPEWSMTSADDVSPPASLSWWYASGPQGARKQFAHIGDGTGGFRRSGIARLSMPDDWHPSPDAGGNFAYTLWVRMDAGRFAAPPRLMGLWPNVAIGRHSRKQCRRVEADWLPLPGNSIKLNSDETLLLAGGTRLRLKERDGRWHWWQPTAELGFHGRDARVFTTNRDTGVLAFGNGETGRIPLPQKSGSDDRFSARDLSDPHALALALHTRTDPISAFIYGKLSSSAAAVIDSATTTAPPLLPLVRALLEGLNGALTASDLYDAQRFSGVALRAITRQQIESKNRESPPRRLNRLLLEDAYPVALAPGAVELHLHLGGGTLGNVGTLREWEPFDEGVAATGLRAINVVAAAGGTDPESFSDARQRAAAQLRRIERAVIAEDYSELARTTPGVAIRRAHVAVGFHPDFPCMPVTGAITVFVVPYVSRDSDNPCPSVNAPQPDAGALAAVTARLNAARLVGTELQVRGPVYRHVALSVDVDADTPDVDGLRSDLTAELKSFLDPLVGGDEGTGWPFGGPLIPSVLLRRAQEAIGDRGEVMRVAARLADSDSPEESCSEVPIRAHELLVLDRITTRVTPNRAPVGGLQ